jgi:DNA-binding GntR family transcriptional regulator
VAASTGVRRIDSPRRVTRAAPPVLGAAGSALTADVPKLSRQSSLVSRKPWVSMVDIAHEALLQEIFDGGSQPGSRLEIRDIAERLSMSPTPVREALAKLATQGLTVLDANRGYRVADLLTRREFHELLAARRAIEIGALTQGAPSGASPSWIDDVTEKQIEEVRRLERLVGTAPRGPRLAYYSEFSRADSEFHRAVLALTSNRYLEASWKGLYCHLRISRLYAGAGLTGCEQARLEHQTIVEALVRRNADELAEASLHHINSSEMRLEKLLR